MSSVFTVLTLLALSLFACQVSAKSVHVSLSSKWAETSFAAEGCEAAIASTADRVSTLESCLSLSHAAFSKRGVDTTAEFQQTLPKDHYTVALEVLNEMLTPEQLELVKVELAGRVYSPLVEAQRLLSSYHISSCWPFLVDASGAVHCAVKEAVEASCALPSSFTVNNTAMVFQGLDLIPSQSISCGHTVLLYGAIGEPETLRMYRDIALEGKVRVVFRHSNPHVLLEPAEVPSAWQTPVAVQGYGVTFDVKNMEYKPIDDKKAATETESSTSTPAIVGGIHFDRLKQRHSSLEAELNAAAKELLTVTETDDVQLDMNVWEIQNLGFQAAVHVMKSKGPLHTLHDLLLNFPLRASKLSRLKYSSSSIRNMQNALAPLHRSFGDGTTTAYINGRPVSDEKLNFFSVLESIRTEEELITRLTKVIGSRPQAPLMLRKKGTSTSEVVLPQDDDAQALLHKARTCGLTSASDMYARNGGAKKNQRFWLDEWRVTWMNDLRTDPMMSHAGTSVRDLLRMNHYGQPMFPRKNVFHAIFVVDPSSREGLQPMEQLLNMMSHGSPFRIGLVFVDKSYSTQDERHLLATKFTLEGTESMDNTEPTVSASAAVQAVAMDLLESEGSFEMLNFLVRLARDAKRDELSLDYVRSVAEPILTSHKRPSLNKLVQDNAFYTNYREINTYIRSVGIRQFPVLLFNGLMVTEGIDRAIYRVFNQEYGLVREFVSQGILTDSVSNIYAFLMEKHGAMRRYQAAIYENVRYVPFAGNHEMNFVQSSVYLHSTAADKSPSLLTHVAVLPPAVTYQSLRMIKLMVEHLVECKTCGGVRMTIAPCTSTENPPTVLTRALEHALQAAEHLPLTERVTAVIPILSAALNYLQNTFTVKQLRAAVITQEVAVGVVAAMMEATGTSILSNFDDSAEAQSVYRSSPLAGNFCSALSLVDPKSTVHNQGPVIYTNGRVTPFDESFTIGDIGMIEIEESTRAQFVWNCIDSVAVESQSVEHTAFRAARLFLFSSVLSHDHDERGPRVEKIHLPYPETPYSFQVPSSQGHSTHARHTFNAVINPIGRESQLLISLVKFFTNSSLSVSSLIYLNPPTEVQKIPIQSIFQFVGRAEPQFTEEGSVAPPAALQTKLPTTVTLTLGLVEPESWMVFASHAVHDLDNIQLKNVHSSTLFAEYTLESILLTGSCYDVTDGTNPSGLPLVTSTRKGYLRRDEGAKDTLVMSNFGYFQLQGNPGVWHLAVQPGVASSIYEVVDVEERKSANVWALAGAKRAVFSSSPVPITSFNGKHVHVKVQKRDGKENSKLLESIMEVSLPETSSWPPAKGDRSQRPDRPTLNIFSVASGHLYERFLRMMFHTVMKSSSDVHGRNTTRIKFWLIENFLSPQFKLFVPHMAAKYGFDYEFVTYKWPHWLRHQTEKQRVIWAYKILFLDVLFPLDVEKVIFVDADQVVRSDLHELYNLDLDGMPMAYTPFCQKNRNDDTKGFRFWDQGFWVDHLQRKPYHISAIYVVDLIRLRGFGAGDTYRMIYDRLSADPHSLANLDQDLPNFAQHQIPIFSLPEEWLWCETWCNAESKPRAKTIDLCNNPMTKTPKLENAKRIIPEWEAMDQELEELFQSTK